MATGVAEGVSMGAASEDNFSQWTPASPLATGWAQFVSGSSSGSGISMNHFALHAANGAPAVRLQTNGTVQSFDGASWSTLGSTFTLTVSGTFDISWSLHASTGHIRIYRDKALVYEFTGNTIFNGVSSVGALRCGRAGNTFRTVSAFIIADEDTRPLRYAQTLISAQGFYAEWTGAVGNVNGTGFSDATLVTTDTPDNRTTYTKAALNSVFNTGWTIEAAVVSARASVETGKAAAMRAVARSDTADGFSAQANLATAKASPTMLIPIDPNTSAAWTVANFNAAQFGVQSRAP